MSGVLKILCGEELKFYQIYRNSENWNWRCECGCEDDGLGYFILLFYIITHFVNIRIIFHTSITPPPLLPSLKYKKSVGSPIALPIIQKDDALLRKSIVRKIVQSFWRNIMEENYRTNRRLLFPVLCRPGWPPKINKIPFWVK